VFINESEQIQVTVWPGIITYECVHLRLSLPSADTKVTFFDARFATQESAMSKMLEGKVALITGAARGIGRSVALRLAREGAMIAMHYGASVDRAKETASEIEALGADVFTLQADLRSVAEIAALFDEFDRQLIERTSEAKFDILINNAGAGGGGTLISDTTEEQFDDAFDLNVKGVFFVSQYAMPRLKDDGRVVNVSSIAARGVTAAGVPYKAAKAALNAITPSLAAELGPRGITVNAVAPGATATDMIQRFMNDENFMRGVRAATALQRLGQPEDVADAITALLSPDCRWITGQIIEASGGARL
jgi:3-oxoacyl-[acyl-carrier protein] reductase